jgi:hypothetical protein
VSCMLNMPYALSWAHFPWVFQSKSQNIGIFLFAKCLKHLGKSLSPPLRQYYVLYAHLSTKVVSVAFILQWTSDSTHFQCSISLGISLERILLSHGNNWVLKSDPKLRKSSLLWLMPNMQMQQLWNQMQIA